MENDSNINEENKKNEDQKIYGKIGNYYLNDIKLGIYGYIHEYSTNIQAKLVELISIKEISDKNQILRKKIILELYITLEEISNKSEILLDRVISYIKESNENVFIRKIQDEKIKEEINILRENIKEKIINSSIKSLLEKNNLSNAEFINSKYVYINEEYFEIEQLLKIINFEKEPEIMHYILVHSFLIAIYGKCDLERENIYFVSAIINDFNKYQKYLKIYDKLLILHAYMKIDIFTSGYEYNLNDGKLIYLNETKNEVLSANYEFYYSNKIFANYIMISSNIYKELEFKLKSVKRTVDEMNNGKYDIQKFKSDADLSLSAIIYNKSIDSFIVVSEILSFWRILNLHIYNRLKFVEGKFKKNQSEKKLYANLAKKIYDDYLIEELVEIKYSNAHQNLICRSEYNKILWYIYKISKNIIIFRNAISSNKIGLFYANIDEIISAEMKEIKGNMNWIKELDISKENLIPLNFICGNIMLLKKLVPFLNIPKYKNIQKNLNHAILQINDIKEELYEIYYDIYNLHKQYIEIKEAKDELKDIDIIVKEIEGIKVTQEKKSSKDHISGKKRNKNKKRNSSGRKNINNNLQEQKIKEIIINNNDDYNIAEISNKAEILSYSPKNLELDNQNDKVEENILNKIKNKDISYSFKYFQKKLDKLEIFINSIIQENPVLEFKTKICKEYSENLNFILREYSEIREILDKKIKIKIGPEMFQIIYRLYDLEDEKIIGMKHKYFMILFVNSLNLNRQAEILEKFPGIKEVCDENNYKIIHYAIIADKFSLFNYLYSDTWKKFNLEKDSVTNIKLLAYLFERFEIINIIENNEKETSNVIDENDDTIHLNDILKFQEKIICKKKSYEYIRSKWENKDNSQKHSNDEKKLFIDRLSEVGCNLNKLSKRI